MPRDGSLILSDVQGLTLVIRCDAAVVGRLMEQHGREAKLTDLLAVLVGDCSKAHVVSVHERCGAVYEGLSA
jgi:hypothetical protein